jgi:signal transduction histidine kinase
VRPPRTDVLLAAGITALGLGEVAFADVGGPRWANWLMIAAIGALLVWRRRTPLVSGLAALVLIAVYAVTLTGPGELAWFLLPILLIAFGFGAHLDGAAAVAGVLALVATVTTINIAMGTPEDVFPIIFMLLAALAGRVVRSRARLAAELHEAALRAEEEREARAAAAVADERRRIAREMHDVVAHSMSVMVVQAGGARRILEHEPERAVAAAEQIELTGREALAEMRRLLGVLRPGDESRAPQPGLDRLHALVERARGAGLPVALAISGERPPLPAGLELAAYRILQEGLTNAIKHADAAPTRVAVRYGAGAVDLLVENDGPGAPSARNGHAAGHGIVGMRERVRMFGGSLEAGERDGGGFRVRATLPFPTSEP